MKDQSYFPLEDDVIVPWPGSLFQRVARVWLRFSGPNRARFNASLVDQERLRRSRILSALFLLSTASPAARAWARAPTR